MEQFIGTKIVQAEPAMKCWGHKGEAHDAGLILTQKELSEKVSDGWEATEIRHGYAVVYEGGYRSWSPKEVFEAAYRRTDGSFQMWVASQSDILADDWYIVE